MNWIIWPAALALCVLCAVGLVGRAIEDWRENRQHDAPAPENNRYYPVWMQNCIALADPLIPEPVEQKERTPAHGRTPQ